MFGINRGRRPVELGPYPMEKLRRDPSIFYREKKISPKPPVPLNFGPNAQLVEAINVHLQAYGQLREPEPFSKKAPVPENPSSTRAPFILGEIILKRVSRN